MKLGKWLKKLLNPRPTDNYVSEIDKFLEKFDATHTENPTALAEKQKHQRIAYLRDNTVKKSIDSAVWKDF